MKVWFTPQFSSGQRISVRVAGDAVTAKVVTENVCTVWVRLSDGNVIKRHKKKHVA